MLEVLSKTICFLIMISTGMYVVGKITGNKLKINKSISLYLILLIFISIFLHPIQYTPLYTITIFLLNIMLFTRSSKLTIEQSTIACSLFMVTLMFSDTIITTIMRFFYSQNEIRTNDIIFIITNLMIGCLSSIIVNIKIIQNKFISFYQNFKDKKTILNIIFVVMLTIGFCYIISNIAKYTITDNNYKTNIIIMIVFISTTFIYLESKNSYKILSDEYDTLFSYVQNFEDWIEKEQLNRHEYKNQLAVLRSITKDKKVIDKIDDILEDNINIEDQVVHRLKELPKGGLKGLMYYKVAIAQKNKIHIDVDVSIKKKSILNKLNEQQIKILCKLIGIYFDNAIEASLETKKKLIIIEVYDLNDKTNIVISNTFIQQDNFNKRNERGVSTKGEGRGNGLYYAANLISKSNWLESKQEIIDNYYIQTISIKKLD